MNTKKKLQICISLAAAFFVAAAWYVYEYGSYPPFMPPGVDLLFFWTRGLVLDGVARTVGVAAFLLIGALVAIYGFRMSRYLK